jgi:hypothetical protein
VTGDDAAPGHRPGWRALALTGALVVAAAATAVMVTGDPGDPGSPGGGSAPAVAGRTVSARPPGLGPQGRRAQFRVECDYSHSAPDDPIVYPGEPGASHLHDFFGATSVDAHSSASDLLGGETTCQQKDDTAAYWAPALFDHDTKVDPTDAVAYYRPAFNTDPTTVEPFPPGLMMIAGNHLATPPQPLTVVAWHCGTSPDLSTEPPECPRSARLAVRVAFPSCWDGVNLDSEDHRRHMAYAEDGRCPAMHPVAVPELVFEVHYPIWGDGHDLVLASGATTSAHADFVNAWNQDKLDREVRTCLNKGRICGVVSTRSVG